MQAIRRLLGVQSSSEFHDHGLRLLVPDPMDVEELHGRRTIDIVFVHGLTGTWDGTWTGETSEGRKVLWPKELLKERFPTARIFSFGYDANAVNLAHRVSTQSVTQHANDLLIELETMRRETATQAYNIVFVVHSLGGLVVQKMLSLSKSSHEAHYQHIESLTVGVVFFGTPMLGADLAAWASIGTALSSILKQTNRDIVGVLEPNSSMAESIRLDFTTLVARRAYRGNLIKIACFYECLPVPGYGKVVVNDRSATWPPHYQKGIQADHMNMTKFASAQARGYRDFIGEIGRWVEEDTGERRQPSDILEHLDYAERTARQQQIDHTDALELTLDWIWSKQHKSRSSFAQWLLNDQAVFWIQGKPGSGKSTLMSYIEKACRSWQVNTQSDSQWNIVRFFFDFRAQSGLANNLEGFLRSLLLQTLKQNPSSEKGLRCFEEKFGSYKVGTWASSTLKEALINVLLETSVNLCILVDGLDEFSGEMQELLTFFRKIPPATNTGHLVKVCLASRPQPVIVLALSEWPGLQMEAHNTDAIEKYAFTTMENLGVAAYDRRGFSAEIAKRAEGVFLWARFAVQEIINGYAEGENISELYQRLQALPPDIEELYAHIFSRMNSRGREEAQILFQLVCFAQQPFRDDDYINLRQLKEAAAIIQNVVSEPENNSSTTSFEELEGFRRRLKAKSGGLLEEIFDYDSDYHDDDDDDDDEIRSDDDTDKMCLESNDHDDETDLALGVRTHLESLSPREKKVRTYRIKNGGMIKLIHRTAESYLRREGWFLGLQSLQITSPHALWLRACCRSIKSRLQSHETTLQHAKPARLKIDKSTRCSLSEYASHSLFSHARLLEHEYQESSYIFLETISSTLWRYLRKQYRIDAPRGNDWYSQYLLDWDAMDEGSDKQPWQIVVEQGLPLCLRDAVLSGHYNPPRNGEDISLALFCPFTFQGMDYEKQLSRPLCSYLIEFGAVVRQRHIIECIYYGDADTLCLLLASWPQRKIRLMRNTLYLPITRLRLLRDEENHTYNGESVGVLWEIGRLESMGGRDFEAKLVLLLERGESLNEVCGPGGTILHGSIIGGLSDDHPSDCYSEMKKILAHGADPNVPGPRGTPLQLAWRTFRSIQVAENVPFHVKCKLRRPQRAMKLLLDCGADPSWVEPNGLSINRHIIEAWCAMSYEETNTRWEDDDYPYCISNWYTYEFPLYRSAQHPQRSKRIQAQTEIHAFTDSPPPEKKQKR